MRIAIYNKWLKDFDWALFIASFLLVAMGLSVIYSLSLGESTGRFARQIISLLLGLLAVGVFTIVDYRRLGSLGWLLYGFNLLILMAVLIFGTNVRGTTGWFFIGSLSFQPVEIVKIFMVIILARYYSQHVNHSWLDWVYTLAIVMPIILLLAIQPDYGPIFIILTIWVLFNALRGLSQKGWLWLFVTVIAVILVAWFGILRDNQKDRIKVFANPSLDPVGRGFQVRQSIIAIGSGGLTGVGLGQGGQSQLSFLPEASTDFVFASLLEQLGFVGFTILILLWTAFFWRIIILFKKAKDDFTLYVVLGLGLLIFIQTIINVAMNLGLAPIVGLPLPFLSYGGSALISTLVAVGILESVALRQRLT